MKFPWFKRMGVVFYPVNIVGWLISIASVYYAVHIFVEMDSRSHSASDTLRNFVFNLVLIWLVYSVIAFVTSWRRAK